MTNLLAVCYPDLAALDRRFIDSVRTENDLAFRDVVAPHFTLLFACDKIPMGQYRDHVHAVVESQAPIRFSCRHAMVCNDAGSDNYYAFLVPDQGFAAISSLHDRLYCGILSPYLRLDIPYIPHIGVATSTDAREVKSLCDRLNSDVVAIDGRIGAITVCSYDGSKVLDLETLAFRASPGQ